MQTKHQSCPACGIGLNGVRSECPLCGKKLDNPPCSENNGIFPSIPVHVTYDFIFKISTFVMIVCIIVVNIINFVFIPHLSLYIPLNLGAVCAWLIVNVGFQKRRNIPKNIMYEAVIAMLLCVLWDKLTGWRGWSIDYVMPVMSCALVVFFFVMGIVDRSRRSSYAGYFMIGEVGIVITVILLLLEHMEGVARYFGAICVGIGVILLLAQIVFRGKAFASEIYRWLHM